MELNKYQELAARTLPYEKELKEMKKEFTLALCEESGEVAGVVKKCLYHGHPFDEKKESKLIEELGDVMWHVAALASVYGLTLEDVAEINIAKLMKRYSRGFTNEDSIKRIDVKE